MTLVFTGVLLMPRAAHAQSSCAAAFDDPLVQHEVAAFEKVAAVSGLWGEYTLARHPLLLVADSVHRGSDAAPVCAAIWRMDRPLELLALQQRPRMSTPLYGMLELALPGADATNPDVGDVLPRVSAADSAVLARRGFTRAVVLQVPLRFTRLGPLGEMMAQANVDPARIQSEMAVHESFHLHVQMPIWLGLPDRAYAWPGWDVQPDRTETRERCYSGDARVSAALESEKQALVAAYRATLSDTPHDSIARAARQFVERRRARYTLLDTTTVALAGRRVDCATAEDLLELEEGLVQWVGHATLVTAGLTDMETLGRSYAGQQSEVFYQTGPLQLWTMRSLIGDREMQSVLHEVATADAPTGIFQALRIVLSRR